MTEDFKKFVDAVIVDAVNSLVAGSLGIPRYDRVDLLQEQLDHVLRRDIGITLDQFQEKLRTGEIYMTNMGRESYHDEEVITISTSVPTTEEP